MSTVIYTVNDRKPTPAQPVENKGTITYAHDPAEGKVKAVRK